MKKITSLLVAMVMMLLVPITSLAEGDVVTVTGNPGSTEVEFSNGYLGFCVDKDKKVCILDEVFHVVDVDENIDNNNSLVDVSQKLKILFTQCFEDIFVSDGSGGYVIDALKADSSLQSAIWNITDDRYVSGEGKTFVEKVDAYDGSEIPDSGYVLNLENGDSITFYFVLMRPAGAGSETQDFFAYKIEVSNTPAHVHTGGEATCVDPAKCEECEEPYGEVDKDNHVGDTEIRDAKEATTEEEGYTGDEYCKSCDELIKEGEVIPKLHKHEGGEATCVEPAKCEECEEPYGEVDKDNHVGDTEIRDAKEPTVDEPGYTGDTYCKSCDELIEEGEEIPKLHKHEGGEATCVDPAKCEECEEPYGEVDKDNHVGDTEIRNAKEPTVDEPGYTGDKYCKSCDELIEKGEVIIKIETDDDSDDTSSEDVAEVAPEDTIPEDTTSKDTPETSDNLTPYLYLGVMLLSMATFVIALRKKVK